MGLMSVRRLSLATAVSLCVFAGCVSFSVPVALAVTPPVVEEVAVLNAAGTSATLQAKINPEGSETTYRFEYGTSAAYGSQIPIPDGLVGSGAVGVRVSVHPQDLAPATTYHYRVVALVASRSETVAGGDGTFVTQPAGGEFALPDGRQWDLVSPPNKHGALIQSLGHGGPIQAAEAGGGIAYGTNVPTEAEPAGYGNAAGYFVQTVSSRGAQGWSTHTIATQHNSTTGGFSFPEYEIFTGDLSLGLAYPVQNLDETLLSSEASEPTPYIRREALCDAPASASECYLPLLTGKEGFADVPPGTKFGPTAEGALFGIAAKVKVAGVTPDLHRVVLSSAKVALTATPIPNTEEIYEWSAGVPASETLQLVSVLPASEGGSPAPGYNTVGVDPGFEWSGVRHSISNDGSRIFWVTQSGDGHHLYMRDTARGETVRIDVQQPGLPSGKSPFAEFQIASSDGSRVFFTDADEEQRLTTNSGSRGYDLYECEIVEEAGKLKCNLTDVTPESGGQSAEVQNLVLGASEGASYIYFVANGVLGDGAEHGATQGTCAPNAPSTTTCNLYVYHNGAVKFVAALSNDDEQDWAQQNYTNRDPSQITARVSPNGRYAAFMSDRPLTGYDNRDASSGKRDMEVYLYDAVRDRLACASCNPTDSRPQGVEAEEFGKNPRQNIVDVAGGGEQWVAGNLVGGDVLTSGGLYWPRALSDSGRLFFNSSDALVPQDINGQEDVYQFELEGVGGCTAASVTFNPKSGGCVGLVSAGTSPEESGFLDASVDGGDVFFLTTSRLTSQDYDTSYDVYDAHECSASVPCVAPSVSSPPCSSGDSCKAAPSPQPSIFGAPASATFVGVGNVVGSSSSPPAVRPRSLTRAQKLARALKGCAIKPKRKRTACERQARKRYRAKVARTTAPVTRKVRG
jgi:hypothetical protein